MDVHQRIFGGTPETTKYLNLWREATGRTSRAEAGIHYNYSFVEGVKITTIVKVEIQEVVGFSTRYWVLVDGQWLNKGVGQDTTVGAWSRNRGHWM